MSFDDNEHANGGNGRFDGLDGMYKDGGRPRVLPKGRMDTIAAAITTIAGFFNAVFDSEGEVVGFGPLPDELKGDIATVSLLREFKAVRDLKEAVDALDKEAGRLYDFLRLVAVPERFENEGVSNMKVEGVGRVQLAGDLYAGIVKGREERAFEWLGDNGRGDLVKQTVNSSSIKAVLKKMLAEGEEIPDFFKAEPFTRASIVKA